jgi:hypothetical protein
MIATATPRVHDLLSSCMHWTCVYSVLPTAALSPFHASIRASQPKLGLFDRLRSPLKAHPHRNLSLIAPNQIPCERRRLSSTPLFPKA